MPSWSEVEAEVPELAALARRLFDAHTHKTLATLRRDGSPRISGIETEFSDGELFVGSMLRGVKALDLQRDGRFALHSGSDEPPDWKGDAKVAGRMEEITSSGESHRFRADITELSVVRLNEARDRLVIESWHPGRGYRRRERR
jgi:Pyridoxamine 5'-phosphate oxidase